MIWILFTIIWRYITKAQKPAKLAAFLLISKDLWYLHNMNHSEFFKWKEEHPQVT